MKRSIRGRFFLILPVVVCAALAGGAAGIVQDQCGPFTDVSPGFCPYVLELYYLGITVGTSPTTFSPNDPLTRGQAAVFVSKGLNQSLARSSRRAALGQWWTTTPHWIDGLGTTSIPKFPGAPVSDGADIWVPSLTGSVSRVRASDGKLLETWTAGGGGTAVLSALGRIFIAGQFPDDLYMIDPSAPPGSVTAVAMDIGGANIPQSLAFDGQRIWTANCCVQSIPPGPPASVSIVTPGVWTVQNVTAGLQTPYALVFDGTNMWVQDIDLGLLRLDASGAVVQSVPATIGQGQPVFDGSNIWVPNFASAKVTVVRAATGEVVATLATTYSPLYAAFDGRRVLLTDEALGLEVWDAQSLKPIGNFNGGPFYPGGICSDGVDFWVTIADLDVGFLARF